MKSEEITAYQTPDGEIFTDENKADKHYSDLLGEQLDGLMRLSKIQLKRTDEFKLIMGWIDQPDELKKAICKIHSIIKFNEV